MNAAQIKQTTHRPHWTNADAKPDEVRAYEFGIDGLLVFKNGKKWNIGHARSGKNIISGWFTRRKDAVAGALYAQRQIPIDWTLSADKITQGDSSLYWCKYWRGQAKTASGMVQEPPL